MADDGKFHGVLNGLSFGGPRVEAPDSKLTQELGKTLLALRNTVAIHDLSRIVFVVPSGLGGYSLPGGMIFTKALASLDFEGRDLLLSVLSVGPWFEETDTATWQFEDTPARALEEALSLNGLAISLDVPPWQRVKLPVKRQVTTDEPADAIALNIWNSNIDELHRAVIHKHVSVLPEYHDEGRHDPESADYIKGKSHRPRNARRVLRHAVPDLTVAGTWWAKCEHGFIHRFSGFLNGSRWRVHWNGTTNLRASQVTREEDVPGAVRERLSVLEPARDCGCRELGDQ